MAAGHRENADSRNHLRLLDLARERLRAVGPLYKRALAMREKALPAGHPKIALSLNNLAFLYDAQGRLTEAEPL